jgi:hypothetical protein
MNPQMAAQMGINPMGMN